MRGFKAKVIRGRGRGRRLGFPTANLVVKNLSLDYGVYLVKVKLGNKIESGLLHWGPRKTFNQEVSCEVYLKNFHKNIYGRRLAVEAVKKIRAVKKFKGITELKKQIQKDLAELNSGN